MCDVMFMAGSAGPTSAQVSLVNSQAIFMVNDCLAHLIQEEMAMYTRLNVIKQEGTK